jgi:general secretion pathway protein E
MAHECETTSDLLEAERHVQAEARFSHWLRQHGKVDDAGLRRAARLRVPGERLSRLLVRLGLLGERDVAEGLSQVLGLPLVGKDEYAAAAAQAPPFPQAPPLLQAPPFQAALRFLKEVQALPIAERDGAIVLAMADPLDDYAARAIEAAASKPVLRAVGVAADIEAAIEGAIEAARGGGKSRMARILEQAGPEAEAASEEEDVEHLRDLASEAPAMRLVSLIVQRAVDAGASDIHLEPYPGRLKVRYRIDGVLHDAEAPPAHMTPAVVSRVKIMARLDIAERRLPQDGRISLRVQGRNYDLRVATSPTLHGESVVLRLLDNETVALELPALGFAEEDAARLAAVLDRPHGMLLVTGPTGSGKTTTLYTALARLNTPGRKVITVEDPVEYRLEGVSQIQVKPSIELTFAAALRSIVRQDPDVIMVGELRDLETARICVQSALTGHLVLSTLHTNDAASTMTRLLEMGIEDYLVTSTVNAVAAQRLVRLLCPHCRERYRPLREAALKAGLQWNSDDGPLELYRAGACSRCNGTGYRGRSAVVELLGMSDPIRRLVLERAGASEIRRAARAEGMRTMYEDGLRKVLGGATSLEELLRVSPDE